MVLSEKKGESDVSLARQSMKSKNIHKIGMKEQICVLITEILNTRANYKLGHIN